MFDEWAGKDEVRDKALSISVAASARRSTQLLGAMVKKVVISFLAILFALSLYVNWELISSIEDDGFYNQVPIWSEKEYEILQRGYKALVAADGIPVGMYPFEISESETGVTIRFRSLEYLQVGSGPLRFSQMFDGCVYYHFDLNMNLIDLTSCG